MTRTSPFPHTALRILTFLLLALLTACSGGGSGGGGGGSSSSGSVGILLTDGPADDFAKLLLAVTRVELIGAGGRVTIFEGRRVFDLLSLRDDARLLGRHRRVPAGKWSKIRIHIEDVELIRVNDPSQLEGDVIPCPDDLEPEDGLVCEAIVPKVGGGGKIDLNPRGPFRVRPGELVLVQLDMDANKSLFVHQNGNGGYILRPLVFVDVFTRRAPDRLVEIEGVVREVDVARARLELCETHAERDRDGEKVDRDACVDVRADADTAIFDADVEPAQLGDLAPRDRAGALGRFRVGDGEALVFDAEVIQQGGFAALVALSGEVLEGVIPGDDPAEFVIATEPVGLGPSLRLTVRLQPGAKLFTRHGEPVDPEDLLPGQSVRAFGLFSGTDPDRLDATLVFVRAAARAEKLRGVVAAPFDAASGELTINAELGDAVAPRCVGIEPGDDVFRVVEDDAGALLRSERIAPSELEVGERVDVYGRDASPCFDAETVVSVGFGE